jgi:hypothetical protein
MLMKMCCLLCDLRIELRLDNVEETADLSVLHGLIKGFSGEQLPHITLAIAQDSLPIEFRLDDEFLIAHAFGNVLELASGRFQWAEGLKNTNLLHSSIKTKFEGESLRKY